MNLFKKYFIDHKNAKWNWLFLILAIGLLSGQIHINISIGNSNF